MAKGTMTEARKARTLAAVRCNQVPYELTLPDPLGDRRLIDGACADSKASRTIFCDSDERDAP